MNQEYIIQDQNETKQNQQQDQLLQQHNNLQNVENQNPQINSINNSNSNQQLQLSQSNLENQEQEDSEEYSNSFNNDTQNQEEQDNLSELQDDIEEEQQIDEFINEINTMEEINMQDEEDKEAKQQLLQEQNKKFVKGAYNNFDAVQKDFMEIIQLAMDMQQNQSISLKKKKNIQESIQKFNMISKSCIKKLRYICKLSGKNLNSEFIINQDKIPYARSYEEWTDDQQKEYLCAIYSETALISKFIFLEMSWLSEFERNQFMQYIIKKKPQFYKPFTKGTYLKKFKKTKFIQGKQKFGKLNQK